VDQIEVIPASHEDWAGLIRRAAYPGGGDQRVVLEVHQRLLAVEARLPRIGTAADVAPQVVSITTADGLSPVEPAPQAQQGVTVEELVCILSEAPTVQGPASAAWLLNWLLSHPRLGPLLLSHPRLGPLLRGEGAPAPVRVVLPEEPPLAALNAHAPTGPGAEVYWGACFTTWAAARAEVERQQGGQADG
jgi:hypothetical protein